MLQLFGDKLFWNFHILEKSKKAIYDNQWFYELQDTMVTDESKRIGPRKNADSLFGFDGSFKKLSVDWANYVRLH